MKYLSTLTLAAPIGRLKTAVTALLPKLCAFARCGADATRFTPPLALRPLTYEPHGGTDTPRLPRNRHVSTGSLLLWFALLTLFALPMETAAQSWSFKINWIRVYKNPKTTPYATLLAEKKVLGRSRLGKLMSGTRVNSFPFPHVINPGDGFAGKNAPLLPSLHRVSVPSNADVLSDNVQDPDALFWVDFDPYEGSLFDTGANSGLVTATENTVVRPGDLVAIAVNIETSDGGGSVFADMVLMKGKPEAMRLNPNYMLDHYLQRVGVDAETLADFTAPNRQNPVLSGHTHPEVYNAYLWGLSISGNLRDTRQHTLVYQFRVEAKHVALNAEGAWMKGGPENVNPFNVPWTGNDTFGVFTSAALFNSRCNTQAPDIEDEPINDPCRPTFDTTDAGKGGPVYYPRIGDYEAITEILDVPTETQTGPFTVTLRFYEDYGDYGRVYVRHERSDAFLAAFQTKLAAGVQQGTVTDIERLSGQFSADGELQEYTRYKVTLTPGLARREMTIEVPADTVFDTGGRGNQASRRVTVPVDTVLPALVVVQPRIAPAAGVSSRVVQPRIVAPAAAGVYTRGDKITVEVPFATDGLTYEGEHPPYVRLYLGERVPANARDAVWQRGEERSGSTIVPFVYVVQETDPFASSVHADVSRLAIPLGTLLVVRDAGRARRGEDRLPVGAGVVAPPLSDAAGDAAFLLTDALGGAPLSVTAEYPVWPVFPPVVEETAPKSAASDVPRSPLVFNEFGNGSGAANDWLELRNVTGSAVSLKDYELSIVTDGQKADTSLLVFADVSVPANGLLLVTNSAPEKTPLAGGEKRGLSHAFLADAGLSLPDDGKFLLILRNAKEKLGMNEAFVDVAGGGGSDTDAFVREQTGDYDTHVWPLQVLQAPGGDTEDALSSGKVWLRAKADIVGYHKDAWAAAAFTGIGYDRKVTKSAATAGTPGYPNGAMKTAAATPKGSITISEVMFDSGGGTLPQWIELYNASKTEALNLNRWQLEFQNVDSEDLVGRPIVALTLQEKVIQPNQTLLLVAGAARASSADVFPADRVYNLLALHQRNLRIKTARDTFLSAEGFYLKLTDSNGNLVDEVGNTDGNRRTKDAPAWALPVSVEAGVRSSLIRRYKDNVARDGKEKASWVLSANVRQVATGELHYGHADDIGTPGYRKGGALPVELSSFTVARTEAGAVVVTWTTESEVDNAGFNLRRSERRDSGFTLLNAALIAGAGTTGERQTYTFTDTSAKPGVAYYYQIEEVAFDGRPETLVTRRLRGPVSAAHRQLTTFGAVKQQK